MLEKPYCAVTSNHISEIFPELSQFVKNNYSQYITYKRGEIIPPVKQNQLVYLVKGSIKSYICDESGEDRLMYILLEDSFVFSSINENFLKTLIAHEQVEACYIERNKVVAFVQTNIEYINKYVKICNSRYGILLQQMLSLNHCSAKHKVYSFIYQLALKYGTVQASTNYIYIKNFPSFTDIASITGVHRSNATSYINELKAQDIVGKDKNHFIIKDLQLFEKIITSLDCHEN